MRPELMVGLAFLLGIGFGIGLCLVWSWSRRADSAPPDGDHDQL